MNPILLDTHAAVWSAEGKLSKPVARTIDEAAERSELLISPITAWEIGMLVQKQRLVLSVAVYEYVQVLYSRPGVLIARLTPAIAVAATTLPLHADPADRILIATAAALGAHLITRDERLLAFASSTKKIRCIRC